MKTHLVPVCMNRRKSYLRRKLAKLAREIKEIEAMIPETHPGFCGPESGCDMACSVAAGLYGQADVLRNKGYELVAKLQELE